jgi:hypothetical protein
MLTAKWMKTPRSARDLMKKCGVGYRTDLDALVEEGYELWWGKGFEDGNRYFWWVIPQRGSKSQETAIGVLEIMPIGKWEPTEART